MTDQAIALLAPGIGTRAACAASGVPQATWYRRHRISPPPQRPAPVPHAERVQPRALALAGTVADGVVWIVRADASGLQFVDPRVDVCCQTRKEAMTNPLMPRMGPGSMVVFPIPAGPITEVLDVGVRAINALLTVGRDDSIQLTKREGVPLLPAGERRRRHRRHTQFDTHGPQPFL